MLASFPQFQPITWSTRQEIDDLSSQFETYSEFNAMNMWCWHTKYREVCQLNGNLVLTIVEPASGERLLTFLGQHETVQTARQLLQAAPALGCAPRLRLIPHAVIEADPAFMSQFAVREDIDSDYLLSTLEWANLEGSRYRDARKQVRAFQDRYEYTFRRLDLESPDDHSSIEDLHGRWAQQKEVGDEAATANELSALQRLLAVADDRSLVGFGLFSRNSLVGFLLCEYRSSGNVFGHFWKADRTFRGAQRFVLHLACREFSRAGFHELNIGQDLGLPGLRRAKQSFQPCRLLRKYAIEAA